MKQYAIIFFAFACLSVFFVSSCTHEKLTPDCETNNMSYAYNIMPILKNNCYSCHSSGNTAGSYGILLDSYESLVSSSWVIPFSTDSSILVGDIQHRAPDSFYSYVPMPFMKHKLDACSINQIVAWVKQGAPNN